MRIITPLLLLGLFWHTEVFAFDYPDLKRHNLEVIVTPAFAYHFITWPARVPGYATRVNNLYRPMAAFNFGVSYIYRPISYFGVSAGFENILYGIKMGKTYQETAFSNGSPVNTYTCFIGYMIEGYMGVPVLLHAYEEINGYEFELTTGPSFLFAFVNISKYSQSSSTGGPLYGNIDNTTYSSATSMRQQSWLAWTAQLTLNVPVKKVLILAVGPEMNFLTIHPLDTGPYYNQISHEIAFYVGCKVGFRVGSNFWKKETAPKD